MWLHAATFRGERTHTLLIHEKTKGIANIGKAVRHAHS